MIDFCNYKWTTAMEGGRIIHEKMPWMWYNSDAVYANGNTAELNAYKDPTTVTYEGKTYRPTVACGVMRSVDTFGYGRFSSEIQLPKGKNLWPSFWLVGKGHWPDNGEIDICEAWANGNGYWRLGGWRTTTNIHWEDNGHQQTGSKNLPFFFSLKRPSQNFIKYEVEWRPNTITFFANGHCVRTYGYDVAQRLADKKMHVIFDCWTTGEGFRLDSPMRIKNFEYKPLEML